MRQEESHAFTKKCFHDELASCSYTCPFRMDIRLFMEKAQRGNWSSAYRIMRDYMVFPDIVAHLCDHPCEEHCVRKIANQPLAIGEVEKACLQYVKSKEARGYNIPSKTKSIAIIGAGVSGLACALRLAVKKYQVTVFDSAMEYGGILKRHPLSKSFLADIKRQFAHETVNFCFNKRINSLKLPGFDAIYVATGQDGDSFGLLDEWDDCSLATKTPGVFLGGMLGGATIVRAIECGARASKQIEKYLMTDEVPIYIDEHPYENRNRYINVEKVDESPVVKMSDPTGYSPQEAVDEAKRCLKCNCFNCMESCEMLQYYRKKPKKISKEIYTDSIVLRELSSRTLTRQVSSCNMCGHCKSVCPTEVDIGAAVLFSRRDRVAHKNYPKAFHDYWLRQMEFAVNEGSIMLPPLEKTECKYAFFPGCQLGSSNPDYVKKAYAALNQIKGSDVGLMLSCCGAPAYWAGEDSLHKKLISSLRLVWGEMGKPTMIFACATCAKLWRNNLPEAAAISLYEVLATADIPTAMPPFSQAVVFDPCSAREDDDMRKSVRVLANHCSLQLENLPFHDEKAKCCGWGGHIQVANRDLYDKIVINRITAAEKPYIVYCANCRDVFAGKGKSSLHILDVLFDLDNGYRKAPTIKEKRDNSLRLKKDMLWEYWHINYQIPVEPGENMRINISDKLAKKMEENLISESIVRATIAQAEKSGEKIIDTENDTVICSYCQGESTFWVSYSLDKDDEYTLHKVYSHRMKVLE